MAQKKKQREEMNIQEKLLEIQSVVDVVQKDRSGYGYKYVSEAELLPKITDAMRTWGVTLTSEVVPGSFRLNPYETRKVKKNSKGETTEDVSVSFTMTAELLYTWYNADNPEDRLCVPWVLIGDQANASMSFGSGLTYCNRYFLLKQFQVATVEDDPDNIRAAQAEALAKAEVNEILTRVGDIIDGVLAVQPQEREAIVKMVSEFVGEKENGKLVQTANFRKIEKKARAMGLLNALTAKYTEDGK